LPSSASSPRRPGDLDEARIRAFQKQHGDIILKPLDGMGGAGIFRVTADGMNLAPSSKR
jgi:glutathione synthase/RimK-type ligase-like ATP-grasp enzyme